MIEWIIGKFKKLKTSDFIKNIVTLVSGNILGYGVNLILLPVISRVYEPSELGSYDLFISSSAIFITVLQLSMMFVIMIPKEDRKANGICKIIWYFTLVGSIISVLLLLLLSPWFRLFELNMSYCYGVTLFGCYLVFFNLQNIYYTYANRKKLYSVLFWNPIVTASINGFMSILLGILDCGTVGYLIGTIMSYSIAVAHMKRYIKPLSGEFGLDELRGILREYRNYPLIQLPAALVSSVALQFPAQFLGRMFSTAVLGGYTMACKILTVPVTLLATPVNRVYYRTLVEKLDCKENAGEFAFSLLKHNILIAVAPIGILMIFGDWIASLVLGAEWTISGTYILIMGIMYLLKYCSSCMSGTFVAVGKQKISFAFSVFTLILHGACFAIAYGADLSVIDTIIFYTVIASIHELVNLLLCMYCLKFSVRKYLWFVLKYIVGSSAVIYFLYGARIWLLSFIGR